MNLIVKLGEKLFSLDWPDHLDSKSLFFDSKETKTCEWKVRALEAEEEFTIRGKLLVQGRRLLLWDENTGDIFDFLRGKISICQDGLLVAVEHKEKNWSGSHSGGDHDGEVITKMPGKVTKVYVNVGDRVEKGMPLLVMEAMKMENEIQTPADGIVLRIEVKPGDQVGAGSVLVVVGEGA